MARLYSARPAGTQGSGADTIPGRNASTSSGSPTTAAASPHPPARSGGLSSMRRHAELNGRNLPAHHP